MAPRSAPCVKVISPNSGTVTTLSRSVSLASSAFSSGSRGAEEGRFIRRFSPASRTAATPPLQSRDINTSASFSFSNGKKRDGEAARFAEQAPYHVTSSQAGGSHRSCLKSAQTNASTSSVKATTSDLNSTGKSSASADPRAAPLPPSAVPKKDVNALPDFFAEAQRHRAAYAPPTRPRSTSQRYRSGEAQTHTTLPHPSHPQPRRGGSKREEEDEAAVRRARAALEHAGGAVLRRPFGNLQHTQQSVAEPFPASNRTASREQQKSSALAVGGADVNASVSTLLGGNTSALPMRVTSASPRARSASSARSQQLFEDSAVHHHRSSTHRQSAPRRGGMRLPPTIPTTRARSQSSTGYDDGESDLNECDSCTDGDFSVRDDGISRRAAHKRGRSWGDVAAENAEALTRRRQGGNAPTASATRMGFDRVAGEAKSSLRMPLYTSALNNSVDSRVNTTTSENEASLHGGLRVCPGMFSGVSAIPLDPKLFAGMESYDAALASPSPSHPAGVVAAQGKSLGASAQQRHCVRPLWSLVGTFKTGLSGLVVVDHYQDCLKWSQRNPKGGQQTIKVPLSQILDVFTTRVVQEDENIEERQFTVVLRTSTRPSQVVFGFATVTEANHLRNVLKRP